MHLPKTRGFTLIELLIVISIIAILVAAATVSWTQAQIKARDGKRKADVKSIQTALELYFSENNSYPADDGGGQIYCEDSAGAPRAILWGDKFECNDKNYMSQLPKDPKGVEGYNYQSLGETPTGEFLRYQVGATLENPRDPEYCTANACGTPPNLPCGPNFAPAEGDNLTYCAIQP